MASTVQYFDTHAHYDFERYAKDRNVLLSGFPRAGIVGVVNIGIDVETSKKSVELANTYPHVWATVGFHPHNADAASEEGLAHIRRLAKDKRVVAIGEMGLDYFRNLSSRENQRKWFERQIELALELDMPVVIHSREAAADTLHMLKSYQIKKGVVHCFNDTADYAQAYQDMGLYVGLGGSATYPKATQLHEAIKHLRPETILLETDCPYLSPHPNRNDRNDSRSLKIICAHIAKLLGIDEHELAAVTTANAYRFYGI